MELRNLPVWAGGCVKTWFGQGIKGWSFRDRQGILDTCVSSSSSYICVWLVTLRYLNPNSINTGLCWVWVFLKETSFSELVWNTGTTTKCLPYISKCHSWDLCCKKLFHTGSKTPAWAAKLLCFARGDSELFLSLGITRNQWQNIKAVHEIFQYWPTSSLIKITVSLTIDFSGRGRPILCANEIAFQKASPVVVSNCSKAWVTIGFQKLWGDHQHCETYFLALGGSNLHLTGCGRKEKPHRGPFLEESLCAFAFVVSSFRSPPSCGGTHRRLNYPNMQLRSCTRQVVSGISLLYYYILWAFNI